MTTLLSIAMAGSYGIKYLHHPGRKCPMAYLQIDILSIGSRGNSTRAGSMTYSFCPAHKALGREDPMKRHQIDTDYFAQVWAPYRGPLAGSAEYLAEENRWMRELEQHGLTHVYQHYHH